MFVAVFANIKLLVLDTKTINTHLNTIFDIHSPINPASFSLAIKDSRQSAIDKRRITRQRGLLLEKLEEFRRINKSVRQKLKQLQDAEVGYNTPALYIA